MRRTIPFLSGLVLLALSPAASADDEAHDATDASAGLGLSSETVHELYGAVIVTTTTAMLAERSDAFTLPELRYAPPSLAILSGGLLIADPLLHGAAAPANYGAESRQHAILGAALLAVGTIDLAAEADWLDHWSWGLALPTGMLVASTSFLFHAQHGDPAQHELMTVQHRVLGATLAVAAIAKGLAEVPGDDGTARWPEMETAWLVAAGLAGVQLILYTEGGSAGSKDHTGHSMSFAVTGRGVSIAGAF